MTTLEAGLMSYSTSEAPRPNRLRSRCRRRISSGAARTRGSCTRTGRGGSRCRWRSGGLRGQNEVRRVRCFPCQRGSRAETLTAGRLVREVQAVWVAVALEALGDAVAAAALEVAGVARPQLWRPTGEQALKKKHPLLLPSASSAFTITTVLSGLSVRVSRHCLKAKFDHAYRQ